MFLLEGGAPAEFATGVARRANGNVTRELARFPLTSRFCQRMGGVESTLYIRRWSAFSELSSKVDKLATSSTLESSHAGN